MSQRPGLGKGLGALIQSTDTQPATQSDGTGVTMAPIEKIKANPHQPRTSFDPDDLKELADSIREHGVIQPLIVMPGNDEDGYTLIAGERRLQAAKQAGLKEVPVIPRQASDRELLEIALIENVQRADLNPLEEAEAYRQLNEDFGLSHEEVAQRVGKSRVAVTNTLRLRNAAEAVKQALVDKEISEGHARALLALTSHEAQAAALKTVKGLTVRQTEELVRKYSGEKPEKPVKNVSPEVAELEERLRSSLETDVKLRYGKKGGTVTIHYYSDEELDKLLNRLL
ncbi:MAG: ParB/RepB/Spo0J family partition protein [Anaerolineales bacterium]